MTAVAVAAVVNVVAAVVVVVSLLFVLDERTLPLHLGSSTLSSLSPPSPLNTVSCISICITIRFLPEALVIIVR